MESLAAIVSGYRRAAERLEEQRRKDIRDSDIVKAIPSFDGMFEFALRNAATRKPTSLTKAQRVLLGIDK